MIIKQQLSNPFTHLQGSLVTIRPRNSRADFRDRGLFESSFTALIVNAGATNSFLPLVEARCFLTHIFYNGSLYEFYLYPDEVSAIP
jgi:hypothetical protein